MKKFLTFLITFTLLFTVFSSVAYADTCKSIIEQLRDEEKTALIDGAVIYDTFNEEENAHKLASTYAIGDYYYQEIENNNTFYTSNRIYHDQTIMGTTSTEDVDHYKFVLLEKTLVGFDVYSYSDDLSFGILDFEGNLLFEHITSYDEETGLGYGGIQINLDPGVYFFGILPLHENSSDDIDYDLYYYCYPEPVLFEPYEDNTKNAQLVNNYINAFGYANENNAFLRNWFINSDENVVSVFISSNITENTLVFDFFEEDYNSGIQAEIWFTYDIATASADEISIAVYDITDDNHYFIASSPFDISKITPYTTLPFAYVDSEGLDTIPTPEQINELGNYLLSEALYYWDAMLGLDLGFSLENLGFDSIYRTPSAELTITKQPQDIVSGTDKVKVTIAATGDDLTYKWQYMSPTDTYWKNIAVTRDYININVTEEKHNYKYRCIVTDFFGNSVISDTITVTYINNSIKIISQPEITYNSNGTAKVSIQATGDGLKYKWQYKSSADSNWSTISTSTRNYINISSVVKRNGYSYRCVVLDANNKTLVSSSVTVKYTIPIVIHTQPNIKYNSDGTALVTIQATGDGLKYRWQYKSPTDSNWSTISTSTRNYINISSVQKRDGYSYRCVIIDAYEKTMTSSSVTVKYTVPIVITSQPKITYNDDDTAKVTIQATGDGLKYRWQYKSPTASNWSTISTSTRNYINISSVVKRDGYSYRCVVLDANSKSKASSPVTVKYEPAIVITSQPQVTYNDDDTAKITIKATGDDIKYKWQYKSPTASNWSTISTSTRNYINISSVQKRDGYSYRCVVIDTNGSTKESEPVTIIKTDPFYISFGPEIVYNGNNTVKITIEASGNNVQYKWQYRKPGYSTWSDISVTRNYISVSNISGKDGYSYRCIVSDASSNKIISDIIEIK